MLKNKEAGLTFNIVEAEGYLRGTLLCFNSVKYVEDMFTSEELEQKGD